MRRYAVLGLFGLVVCGLCVSSGQAAPASGEPFMGAYIHMDQCFDKAAEPAERETAIAKSLDRFKASGLRTIMPYATTTGGAANYPSDVMPLRTYGDWDPLGVFVREARKRGLEVYPVICVLHSGRDEPRGILKQHPDWALRDEKGKPTGSISPGHPAAREYVIAMLKEIVAKYEPEGLLLDYLRFPSQRVQMDPVAAAKFTGEAGSEAFDQYKRDCLTELAARISREIRQARPGIRLALYTWGSHVVKNHRVSQDWLTWAKHGYIDMVNVSGYCFTDNYGDKYLEVYEKRLRDAAALLKTVETKAEMTVCVGVKTSHGQVKSAREIDVYLQRALPTGVQGAAFFTWSYMQPYIDEIDKAGYVPRFAEAVRKSMTPRGAERSTVEP